MDKIIEKLIHDIIVNRALNKTNITTFFEDFITKCQEYYDRPVHNLKDLSQRNKKTKGDIFEYFALKYLKHCYGLNQVWLIKDVPVNILTDLHLRSNDMGIDIIGEKDNEYYAIQVKYRTKNRYKNKTGITWKELSTFYGLVSKTGPYVKNIVLTNVDYVRHIGKKTKKDTSICVGTLSKITTEQWYAMASFTDQNLIEASTEKTDDIPLTDIREKRLKYFLSSNSH